MKDKNVLCSTPSAKIKFGVNEPNQKKYYLDSLVNDIQATGLDRLKSFLKLQFFDDTPSPALVLFFCENNVSNKC